MSHENEQKENEQEGNEDDKENVDETRADTSMSNSTFMSTGRVQNEKAEIGEDGVLDLSNLSLTNLERNFSAEYGKVKKLIISGNCFQKFTYMKLFAKCEVLDAQDCQINKFVADFNYNLKELFLGKNQLKEISQLGRFENLKILDVSSNQVEEVVCLPLKNLEILDLSFNSLKEFPNLIKCSSLHTLNISNNKISDISKICDVLIPTNITKLDISANSIDDLSQFSSISIFKKLKELSIAGNPCIDEVIDSDQFDYRSYIFACCSEALETIEDSLVEDHIQTEGEWLAIQGGIKKIGPGNHEKLCEVISSHFPKTDSGPPTPAQKSCHKALEKRRNIVPPIEKPKEATKVSPSDTDRTLDSVYSPFREWNSKMEKFTTKGTGTSGNRSHPTERNLRMVSPPESRKNRSFTCQYEGYSSSINAHTHPQQLVQSSRTNSTDTVVLSRDDLYSSLDDRSEATPLPIIDDRRELKEVPSTSSSANRRTPVVDEASFIAYEDENNLQKRVCSLEAKVGELIRQNSLLSETNDGLVETLELFKTEQKKMWSAIKSSIPTPKNLMNTFVSENEDGHQIHTVKWEMPTVKSYRIYIDGNFSGEIIGKNNSARITDLSANESHCVQIQPIGNNGEPGEISKKLYINPQ